METIDVIAVIIEVGRGKYIISQRDGGAFVGLWEFPGGTLEEGESNEQCAYREIEREEYPKLEIRLLRYVGESVYEDESKRIRVFGYHAAYISGEIESTVHRDSAVVHPDQFKNYQFVPADEFFVEQIKRGNI